MFKPNNFFINDLLSETKFKLFGFLIFSGLIFICSWVLPAHAATVTSTAAGGDWATASTWVGGVVPANADTAVIATTGGNSVTISANKTIANITVNSGATLAFTGAFTLTINGKATINGTVNGSTGIFKMNANPSVIDGSGTINNTVLIQQPTSIASTANITINGTINVANTFTINSGGTLNAVQIDSNKKTVANNGTVNLSGNYLATGSPAVWTQGTNAVVNIGGAFTPSASITLNASASGNVVNYNGTSAQVADIATYYTFKANNAAGVTLSGATTITNLTIGDSTSNSIFSDGGYVITPGTGSVLTLTSGTYQLGSGTVGTSWPSWGTANISSGTTVNYASGVAQAISASPSYQNLSFTGAGTKTTAAGTISVGGNWNVDGGTAALNTNNSNVTVTGNVTGAGAITSGTGNITLGGNWTNSGTFTKDAGTVTYNGSSSQTVAVLNYNNLVLSGVGQKNSGGNISVGGNLTNSSVFDMSGNTLSVSGSIANTGGTIRFSGTTNGLAIGTGTVEYYGSSQTITSGTYSGLKINQSAGSATLGGVTTVGGVLTLLSGNIVTGANNLYINSTGSVTRTSGYVVGNFRKYIGTIATTETFQIGDASGNYTPVTVSFGSVTTAGDLTVSTTAGDHPNINTSVFSSSLTVNRYWTLTNSVSSPISFTNYSATFNFINPGDLDSGVNTNYLKIGRYSSSSWTYPTMGTLTSTSSQASGLTAFGDFQIGQYNPTPSTSSISPTSKTAGDAQFTLTVNGTNFISNSSVYFNGSARSTSYVNSTQLTATILSSDLTSAGTFNITVVNPTPGGGTSNAQTFTVNTASDTTAPTVTAFTIPSTSSSLTVSITTFTATDNVGVADYLLTETASTPSGSDSGWSSTAQTSYIFSSEGAKTLYAWAKDAAGNISSSLSASVTITLADTTAPTVTAFTIPSTSSSLTVSITTFTATDNVGVTDYLLTETASTPSGSDSGWSSTAQTSYIFSSEGAKTLYAWAKDAAGNISSSLSASVTITLADTTAPTVTAFTIPSTSSSLTVSITTFTATDNVGVTDYLLTETASTPSGSDSGWSSTAQTSYIFATAGSKTLYAWAKDAAGNISSSLSASVTITLPASSTISYNQIQSSISSGIIVPNNTLNSSTFVTFNKQVQINFDSSSRMTVPINTVMNAGATVDFSFLAATSTVTVSGLPANYTSISAVNFGLPSNSLTADKSVTIDIYVGVSYNSQTLYVFKKSPTDSSWSQLTTCIVSNGFCEFTSTGFSDFCAAKYSAPSAVVSGNGGIVEPTGVTFSGRGYPQGKIRVYRRSLIEQIFRNEYLPDFDITVGSDGNFSKTFTGLLQSNYLFALEGTDKNGVSGGIVSFTTDLLSNNTLNATNIFLPPTISFDNKSVTKGKTVKVFGYAYPNTTVELRIDNVLKQTSTSDSSGYYEVIINTQRFSSKTHFVEARQVDNKNIASQFSAPKNFIVSALNVPQADFNNDGVIDIKDWSIFLFRWKAAPALRAFDDLNLDGKVDIADLSIFLKAIKGI